MREVLRAGLRYLLRHRALAALSVLGVALGVAVVVAVDLANASAERAFHLTVETVAGRATDQVVAGRRGIPDSLYRRLALNGRLPRRATPVLEGSASLPDGERVRLVGIDPISAAPFRPRLGSPVAGNERNLAVKLISRPRGVLLPAADARVLGVKPGDSLPLTLPRGRVTVRVVATLPRGQASGVVLTDIATAQDLLGRAHHVSRIDLILPPGAAGRRQRKRLAAALPPGVSVQPVGTRTRTMEEMTRAFRINLTALSLLALVVGMFLIYNTMTFSVVQRRELFGTLRSLGVGRGQLFLAVTVEAALVGAAGTAIGIGLGTGLAEYLVHLVTRTINDLYFALQVRSLALGPSALLQGTGLGIGATVAAALLPALEAARVSPRAALARSDLERRSRALLPWLAVAGIAFAGLGAALLALPLRGLAPAYGALLCLIVAISLWIPGLTVLAVRTATAVLPRGRAILARLSLRGISAGLSRTSVAIAALAIALATTVGVGTMIGSFRASVIDWLDHSLTADLFVGPGPQAPAGTRLPPRQHLARRIGQLPGVVRVSRMRRVTIDSGFGPVSVTAFQMRRSGFGRFELLAGRRSRAWKAFSEPGRDPPAVLVSQPLAYHQRLHVGSRVRLHTAGGPKSFEIVGIYRNYGSSRGRIAMARRTYLRYWHDASVTGLAVYLAAGAPEHTVSRAVRRMLDPSLPLTVSSNRQIRRYTLRVFDQTFAITAVLRLLAMIISIVGVISALMALQLERVREFGVFRALGMTPRETRAVVVGQTGFMGLLAGALSLPAGLVLADVLVSVVNRRAFGWTMQFRLLPGVLWQALAAAVVAALLAGAYPAWRLGRMRAARALREE
ncbi:MAG TPA: FtsX-like permease family protein [Gammaproteobacteria bacterium]|nr:FtsX-like permease family protein [Gammaproteobacteria bacterium]